MCLTASLLAFVLAFVVYGYLVYFLQSSHHELDNNFTKHCNQSGVSHCGSCGDCSNSDDLRVYEKLNMTLTCAARKCAIVDVFDAFDVFDVFDGAVKCFDDTINFTEKCRDAWFENIDCDKKHCMFVCLWENYFVPDWDFLHGDSRLTRCLACDERHCLDIFLKSAGMTRRRAGIKTDIKRDDSEICKK